VGCHLSPSPTGHQLFKATPMIGTTLPFQRHLNGIVFHCCSLWHRDTDIRPPQTRRRLMQMQTQTGPATNCCVQTTWSLLCHQPQTPAWDPGRLPRRLAASATASPSVKDTWHFLDKWTCAAWPHAKGMRLIFLFVPGLPG